MSKRSDSTGTLRGDETDIIDLTSTDTKDSDNMAFQDSNDVRDARDIQSSSRQAASEWQSMNKHYIDIGDVISISDDEEEGALRTNQQLSDSFNTSREPPPSSIQTQIHIQAEEIFTNIRPHEIHPNDLANNSTCHEQAIISLPKAYQNTSSQACSEIFDCISSSAKDISISPESQNISERSNHDVPLQDTDNELASSPNRKRSRSIVSQQKMPVSKKQSPSKLNQQVFVDDNVDGTLFEHLRHARIRDQVARNPSTIVLEDYSDVADDDSVLEEIMSTMPRTISIPVSPQQSSAKLQRNAALQCSDRILDSISFRNLSLRPGKTVEFHLDEGFLYITDIIKNNDGRVRLRGHNLERCRHLNGMFEFKKNELCWVQEIDEDDPRPQQGLREIALEDVTRIRATHFTNEKYTPGAWKRGLKYLTKDDAEIDGWLIVRFKMTTWWATARAREVKACHFPTRAVEMLTERDLKYLKVSFAPGVDSLKRFEWRGETVQGGAFTCNQRQASKIIDLTDDNSAMAPSAKLKPEPSSLKKNPNQKYTYFDAFCGAGGATRGAANAGLHIQYGFDRDEWAANSWRKNFEGPTTTFYQMTAFDLIIDNTLRLKSDVIHLSPPCQYFSPAHTVPGLNDEENFTVLFSCGQIIDAVKPRVGTLEQTSGLAHLKFRKVFNQVIQMFTKRGYSVRWKLCSLPKWGLPQRRTRLLMVFAGPGEILPDFPDYTHADPAFGLNNLRPFVTMNDVFRTIPTDHPLHNINTVKRHVPPKPQYSGDKIAPRCITTSGGQNYHPEGHRNLTLAEFAVAQGFPLHHQFSDRCVTKQIGNAYAPNVATVIFKHLRKALEKVDGFETEEEEEEEEEDIVEVKTIIIDDDDDDDEDDVKQLDQAARPVTTDKGEGSVVYLGLAEKKMTMDIVKPKDRQLSIVDLSLEEEDDMQDEDEGFDDGDGS